MIHVYHKAIPAILLALSTMVCAVAYADAPSAQPERPHMRHGMPWGGARGKWAPNLTDSERQQLKTLAIGTLRETRQDLSAIAKSRRDLRECYESYKIDEKARQTAALALNQAQAALLKLHLNAQIRIRQILSRDSFESLRNLLARIGESIQKMPRRPRGDRNWRAPAGVQPTEKQSEILAKFEADRAKAMDRIAGNAKLLIGVYSKYDLDQKAASSLIAHINRDQTVLTRLHLRMQKALRTTMTEDEFNAKWKRGLTQPEDKVSPK